MPSETEASPVGCRHPSLVLQDASLALCRYNGGLYRLLNPPHLLSPICEIEEQLARSALDLLGVLEELRRDHDNASPSDLPTSIRRDLVAVERIVVAQLERWGWEFLRKLDGASVLKEKRDAHGCLRDSYLAAVRTCRLSPDAKENRYADDLADEARERGIAPDDSLTPVNAEASASERYERWKQGTMLSGSRPESTGEERTVISTKNDTLRDFVGEKMIARRNLPEFCDGREMLRGNYAIHDTDESGKLTDTLINRSLKPNIIEDQERDKLVWSPRAIEHARAQLEQDAADISLTTPVGTCALLNTNLANAQVHNNNFSKEHNLTNNEKCILIAMLRMGASTSASRRTANDIAYMAIRNGGENIKRLMSRLVTLKYAESIKGRTGGSWLTPRGLERAQELTTK